MAKIGCLLTCLIACLFCHSQDLSNKGKDFWITYPAHVDAATSLMGVYITSDQAATGAVQVGGGNIPFTITANTVKTIFIGSGGDAPNTAVYLSQSDGIATNAGIHVTSNRPVVVYAHIIKQARSGASLLLPSTVWGKEYIVPSHGSAGQSGANSGVGIITVVAKDTNTVVEIDPKVASLSGRPAGIPYSILLSKPGDVYQVQYQKDADISGTKVRSIATGNSTCKPIGVFSSTTWSAFDCIAASGGDNLYQQLFPVRAFGKIFITAPFYNRNTDILRVFVADPTTVVKRTENGATTTLSGLQNNSFYEFKTNLPNKIEANKPISVVQYITSQSCYNVNVFADPEMVILSPLEQTINNITVFSAHQKFVPPGQSNVNQCYLNIIIKTGAAASFKINGAKPTGNFVSIPGTGYSYLQEDVSALSATNPVQTLIADSSFSAIAYGYGNVESYGYNAGTNVRDLYQYITIKNQNATINYPATCVNTPFQFGIVLPYLPTKLTWQFYGQFPDVTINNPAPDSSFVLDGKNLYRFKLGNSFSYNVIGSFPVSVTATNPSSDGCNGEQQIDYDLQVYEKPKAFFTWTHSGCVSDPVVFHDSSNGLGANVNRWHWEFGDNTSDSIKNPTKKYNAGGSFTVKESIITDVGCLADTTATINVSVQPVANFNIVTPYCAGSTISFTDASTITPGTIKKWYWDFGNGSKDTVTTNAPRSAVYKSGTYTASLVVESSTGCKSVLVAKTFTVNDLPVPDFKLPQVVCLPAGPATFTNQSTIANGTVNIMTYKWDFGDGASDIAINPVHIYKTAGPFTIKLTATSSAGCSKDSSKIFSNIFAQPVADFNASPGVCIGQSSVFSDASSISNQTIIKYGWNLANGVIDSTKNITTLYTIPATYQVKHWVVSDKGCFSDTVTKAHVVNPLPTAQFTITGSACENKQITFVDQSIPNAGTITRWQWNMGDGITRDVTTGSTFQYSYNTGGNKVIKLVATSKAGCVSDTLTKTVQVNAVPFPEFGIPEVCLSDAFAQFTDSSSIADGSEAQFTYLWNFGDANANASNPNTSILKNSRHKYTAAGVYTVSLSVTSKDGCNAVIAKTVTVNGDKPKADFDVMNVRLACSNAPVSIINRSTVNFGNITKTEIYWEWPSRVELTVDDEPQVNEIYDHLYQSFQTPASRTFSIRFLAYSGGVCVNEIIKTVTVNAVPEVIFTQVPGFCPNASSRQITQVSTLGNLPGTGNFSGTGISATGLFNPAVAGIGSHPIEYIFISNGGCTDTGKQTITVWPAPTAAFTVDPPICVNTSINFNEASLAGFGKIISWNWDYGNGSSETRRDSILFQKIYTNTGTYTVQLQVATDSGCVSNVVSKPITINPIPVVDFDVPSICVNAPATFTDRSTIADGSQNQFAYKWDFGIPGAISTVKNPVFMYTAAAPYKVSLQVTSKDGCVNSLTKPITDINPQPLASFTFSPAQVCLGQTIDFMDMSNALNQTILAWHWDFDDSVALNRNPSHTYTTEGTKNISLYYTTSKGCTSDTLIKQVVVNPIPVVDAGPDQFVLEGGYKTLLATAGGSSAYSYRWTPATWLNNTAVLQPITTPGADITYTLTVTGAGGCAASDIVFVKFVNLPVIPNAFSPNGDGINDTWGIKYLDSYPGSTISVFDRYGRQVYAGNGSSRLWDGYTNGKPLPLGVYYYIIDIKNGKPALTGSLTIIR
jgi:gliding motility-associated-like protein